MPAITLPDQSVRRFDGPVTGTTVAEAIGPGLARAALAMKLDGKVVDLATAIDRDAAVTFITRRDPEALELIRHDAAHVLAEAVQELYPGTQVTIGPAIADGFYYDFARNEPFTPEDFAPIEAKMREIVARGERFERSVMDRDEAIRFFQDKGEKYKAEIIQDLPREEPISLYRQGDWVDLCRGPHMRSTADVGGAFKLMKVAGAYWRGDHRNAMLSRIYGTAWRDQKELDAYLHMLEEAERRDHRRIGKEMDLFHLQEEAAGSVFWHPKGWKLYRTTEAYLRRRLEAADYREVKTPQLLDRAFWERSGHWDKFRQAMFVCQVEDEDKTLALKPMNCPCHIQIFRQGIRSYRELPLRLAEFGACHRYEPSGALHGIMRVRSFVQDDAHIFCTEQQIASETVRFVELLSTVYRDFGFPEFSVKFSDRPPMRVGADEVWDHAEAALREACADRQGGVHAEPGGGGVLRPQARVRIARRNRAGLAVRHAAGGFHAAGAAGRRIRGRGRGAADAGDAAPRHPGQLRAFPGDRDRAVCRSLPAVAGAGAGGGGDHRLGRRRLRARGGRGAAPGGSGGRARPLEPEDQRQGARAQPGACAGPRGGRAARGGAADGGAAPAGRFGAAGAAAGSGGAGACSRGHATRSEGVGTGHRAPRGLPQPKCLKRNGRIGQDRPLDTNRDRRRTPYPEDL